MPDILAELARTAQIAGALQDALAACEDALCELAALRVDQSLVEIRVSWDGRVRAGSRE